MSTKTKKNKHGRKGVGQVKHTQAVGQPTPKRGPTDQQLLKAHASVLEELVRERDQLSTHVGVFRDALEQVLALTATARTGSGKAARDVAKVALGAVVGTSS